MGRKGKVRAPFIAKRIGDPKQKKIGTKKCSFYPSRFRIKEFGLKRRFILTNNLI